MHGCRLFCRGESKLGAAEGGMGVTEATGRPLVRVTAFVGLALSAWSVGALRVLGDEASFDALLGLLPLLSILAAAAAAHLRIEHSPWRIEAPFVAGTLVTLGPSWALATWAGGRIASFAVRGANGNLRKGLQEFGGIALATGLAAAAGTWLSVPAAGAASAYVLLWLFSVRLMSAGIALRPWPIVAGAGVAAAMGGIAESGALAWTALSVLPAFLMARIALEERRVDRSLDQTLQALALMLQRAHPYTHAHIERVARIAEKTARLLGLSEVRSQHVHDAARFHDIGKIAVDEQILDKPGSLTPEEYDEVKKHAPFGAAILEEMPDCRHLADWIRSHHERPDGNGYPHGLRGNQIPIEARIIAVADAYDAMTGGYDGGEPRPYRKPMSPKAALEELDRGSGSQFDPEVVAAFRRAVAEDSGQ